MKRLGCLLVSICLVLGILLIAVADVNHGHGPGYVAEDGHGETDGHGDSTDDHGESTDGHGEPVDNHGEPADAHATTIEQVH